MLRICPSMITWIVGWTRYAATLAPNTVRRYGELTRIHIKPALGKAKLSKLDPLRVQSFYRSKLDEGLSAATVVKIHSTLSKVAQAGGAVEADTPERLRVGHTTAHCKDGDSLFGCPPDEALLRAAEGTDLNALWVLLATTGLRIGEALALRWDDLDSRARTLRVNRTVFRNVVSQPKTKSSRRTIKLSGLAIGALGQHPARPSLCSVQAVVGPSTRATCVTARGSG
jgi:integrase